jgi:hypothetical protein
MPKAQRAFAAQTVAAFPQVLNAAAYTPVPPATWIAVTDVAGSTQAIENGRYKDVNLAGATGIAAFINAFPEIDLPFVFGGDGATILVPDGLEHRARTVLQGLQSVAQSAIGLPLRTALIPVERVRRRGLDVRLVYQTLAGGRDLPMVSGGGALAAEILAKQTDGEAFLIEAAAGTSPPNLDGLSCRWQPVVPQRGLILAVLLQGPHEPESYLPVFDRIAHIAAGPQSPLARPPNPTWPPRGLLQETRLRAPSQRLPYALSVLGQSALGALSTYTGVKIGGFDGRHYRESLAKHCDALKFADGLKMVVDCSPAEADALEAMLNEACSHSDFEYGLQRSTSALMTCFVQTTADAGHLHFIDGAQGGYALAARQLKGARR